MNYNIKCMYILIMRYVNMMTYNYEIKDQNYEMKLQVMKSHNIFMPWFLYAHNFYFLFHNLFLCQFWLNYYLYANF